MSKKHTCPRRVGEPGPWEHEEGLDGWTKRADIERCDFCGSIEPDEFMRLVREGYQVGPTDKSYKAYMESPDGRNLGKFYFQHLTIDQRVEFVELLNNKSVNIGYPGHFYVRPFFVVPVEE